MSVYIYTYLLSVNISGIDLIIYYDHTIAILLYFSINVFHARINFGFDISSIFQKFLEEHFILIYGRPSNILYTLSIYTSFGEAMLQWSHIITFSLQIKYITRAPGAIIRYDTVFITPVKYIIWQRTILIMTLLNKQFLIVFWSCKKKHIGLLWVLQNDSYPIKIYWCFIFFHSTTYNKTQVDVSVIFIIKNM